MQDMEKSEMIHDAYEIEQFKKEVAAVWGFALSAKNIFAETSCAFNKVKYKEYHRNIYVLENNCIIKELNENALFNKHEPAPRKKWQH